MISRRTFLTVSGAALTLGPASVGMAAEGASPQSPDGTNDPLTRKPGKKRTVGASAPNVLFLMTDQQSWNALGVLNPGVKTPNLDRLAARGIVFDQAVCQAPMCIPSRYSMTTGMYPGQIGVRSNGQTIQDSRDLRWPTMFMQFADAGWRTIGSGKTHWTNRPDPERGIRDVVPSTFGFEERYIARLPGGHDQEPGAVYFGDADQHPDKMAAIRQWNIEAGSGGEGPPGYLGRTLPGDGTDLREAWLTDQAIAAIERAHAADEAWFAYLSFDAPHAPLYAPEAFEKLYDLDSIPDPVLPPDRAALTEHHPNLPETEEALNAWLALDPRERKRTTLRFYALCSYVDAQFGRILDYLEDSGQAENTIVVFTSDHGESLGNRYRFSKYSLYEDSVRVPLILAGPTVPATAKGTRDSRPAELVDLFPTLLEATGQPVPDTLPGENLLMPGTRVAAYSEMHGNGSDPIQRAPALMWRNKDWKLIVFYDGTIADSRKNPTVIHGELYHLTEDPGEAQNLFDDPAHAALREQMTRELFLHVARSNATAPVFDSMGRTRGNI